MWLEILTIIVIVALVRLKFELNKYRVETQAWKHFESELPAENRASILPFLPSSYVPAGKRLYKWFIAASVLLIACVLTLALR